MAIGILNSKNFIYKIAVSFSLFLSLSLSLSLSLYLSICLSLFLSLSLCLSLSFHVHVSVPLFLNVSLCLFFLSILFSVSFFPILCLFLPFSVFLSFCYNHFSLFHSFYLLSVCSSFNSTLKHGSL